MNREVDTLPTLLAAPAPVFADAVEEVAEEVVKAVPEDESRVVTVVVSVEDAGGGEATDDGGGGTAVEGPRAGAAIGPRRMVVETTGGGALVDGFDGAAIGLPGRGAGKGVRRTVVETGGGRGAEDEPGIASEEPAAVDDSAGFDETGGAGKLAGTLEPAGIGVAEDTDGEVIVVMDGFLVKSMVATPKPMIWVPSTSGKESTSSDGRTVAEAEGTRLGIGVFGAGKGVVKVVDTASNGDGAENDG